MRVAWILCVAGSLMFAAERAQAAHYDVFILAGQSNMDGRAKRADLTGDLAKWAGSQNDVRIAYSDSGTRGKLLASNGWEPLAPGFSVPPGRGEKVLPGATFGPEVAFGRTIADEWGAGKHVALIKFAEGGTSLAKDWQVGTDGKLYAEMVAFVGTSLAQLKKAGDTYDVRGFVWHQGESDAKLSADRYQQLLTALIEHLRADVKAYRPTDAPELPVVVGEVYDNHGRDSILAAQRAVCGQLKACALASAAGLKTLDAGTHFDARSQIELGKRMADAMATLLGKP